MNIKPKPTPTPTPRPILSLVDREGLDEDVSVEVAFGIGVLDDGVPGAVEDGVEGIFGVAEVVDRLEDVDESVATEEYAARLFAEVG